MATNRSLKNILNKGTLTGEEVGRALMASLLHDIANKGKAQKPLFTQAEFNRMLDGVTENRDIAAYNTFLNLHNSVMDTRNRAEAYFQQFYNGYYRLLMYAKDALTADSAERELQKRPYIMTQEEYEAEYKAALEWQRSHKESFRGLLLLVARQYALDLEEGEKNAVPRAISAELKALAKQPVTNRRILADYYGTPSGYHVFPNGKREDKSEDWYNDALEYTLTQHKLYIDGKKASKEELLENVNFTRTIKVYDLFYNGAAAIRAEYKEVTGQPFPKATDEQIEAELQELLTNETRNHTISEALRRLIVHAGGGMYEDFATWRPGGEWPEEEEGLSKLGALADYIDLYDEQDEGPTEREAFREFKADYPKLYALLEAELKKNIPQAADLKPTQYFKEFITWGELADLKLYDYEEIVKPDHKTIAALWSRDGKGSFYDRWRIMFKGIAVLIDAPKNSAAAADELTQNDAIVKHLRHNLFSLAADTKLQQEIGLLYKRLIIPALKYLFAYNALIEITGEVYDVPGMDTAKVSLTTFINQINGLNGLLKSFYFRVEGNTEDQRKKRALIKSLFPLIDIEALQPTEKAKESLRQELTQLGYKPEAKEKLRDFDGIIEALASRKGAGLW